MIGEVINNDFVLQQIVATVWPDWVIFESSLCQIIFQK